MLLSSTPTTTSNTPKTCTSTPNKHKWRHSPISHPWWRNPSTWNQLSTSPTATRLASRTTSWDNTRKFSKRSFRNTWNPSELTSKNPIKLSSKDSLKASSTSTPISPPKNYSTSPTPTFLKKPKINLLPTLNIMINSTNSLT